MSNPETHRQEQLPSLPSNPKPLLQTRNAIADWDHVSSRLVANGVNDAAAVTVAIPTYQRPEFLAQTVESVLRQTSTAPIEILVVDNDPASTGGADLMARFPALKERNFRYYVNDKNLGMFGNWNRCITLARGEWLTILNDDDLFNPGYMEVILAELHRRPDTDGIVCRKEFLDERLPDPNRVSEPISTSAWSKLKPRVVARKLIGRRLTRRVGMTLDRLRLEQVFLGRTSRPITPKTFFFGSLLGNGGGFIFRRDLALQLGGYYPEEFPAADYWFYTRFSAKWKLRQHRAVAVTIRKAENETAKRETVKSSFRQASTLQRSLAGEHVPAWWLRLSPLILAWHRADFRMEWGVQLTEAEIEEAAGIRPSVERTRLLNAIRLLLRGV
jgi:glycosyltransferase involved in cell wall biosynthesis